MRHFVAYNNDQEWGAFSADDEDELMSWYSNKNEETLRESIGQYVWMISGSGRSPKAFYLHGFYVPDDVIPDDSGTGFRVCGDQIYLLDPPLFVNEFAWFQKLKNLAGRFGFGFIEINDTKIIQALKRATEKNFVDNNVEIQFPEQSGYGAGFGNAQQNKKVETKAVSLVTNLLTKQGWAVRSVESERLGYDLRCQKKSATRNVEVKGVSGNAEAFIITANEIKTAKKDKSFWLYVVLETLTNHPRIKEYASSDFLKSFSIEAKDYFAKKRQ